MTRRGSKKKNVDVRSDFSNRKYFNFPVYFTLGFMGLICVVFVRFDRFCVKFQSLSQKITDLTYKNDIIQNYQKIHTTSHSFGRKVLAYRFLHA